MISIQSLIDQQIKKENKPRKTSGKISPSSMGRCFRYQYWNRKGEEVTNPPDDRLLRVFKAGKLFHDFVQNLLPNAQTEVLCETEDIKGYADVVLDDEVIDIKSQHSRAFWYMQKSESIQEDKFPNILQVLTYAWILKKPKTRLCFVSKDDLCIAEYGFYLSEEWEKRIQYELSILRTSWKIQVVPPAEPRAYLNKKTSEYKECGYCPYKNLCQEVENGTNKSSREDTK